MSEVKHISPPHYITLEHRQQVKLDQWANTLPLQPFDEEDCAPMSRFEFHVRNHAICTEIWVTDSYTDTKCDLTIDDNDELDPL